MDSLQEPHSCSRCERDCVRTQDYCIVCRVVIRGVVGVQRNMDPASRYSGVAQFAGGVAAARHDEPMQHCGYDHNGCIMSSSSEVVHQQECNMCGDVGFADQLQHCSACRSRIQHTYCSTSMEGADSGSWICDWCRVAKQPRVTSKKERRVEIKESCKETLCTASNGERALELLLKAALTPPDTSELGLPQARFTNPSQASPIADCGSNCSSSLESEKLMSLDMASHSCGGAEASSSCENQMVLDMNISDEEGSLGMTPQVQRHTPSTCDIKRSPNSLRCSVQVQPSKKLVKQKSAPGSRSHVSSSTIPVPLKRLSSLKSMPRSKSVAVTDSPKGLVRRYKSLSDISY